ncbi:putative lipid II flippase FtsW [Candidatus Parcubacteria bacterium]|nr:MAG: putative lipid II flippase FtsW [Candidatus Parcubacteria bacterium]
MRRNFKNLIAGIFNPPPDYFLSGLICFMVFAGLVFLSSASSISSYKNYGGTYYLLLHQITFGFLPGLFFFYLFFRLDYHVWKKWSLIILGVSLVLLLAVFLPKIGSSFGTARSWINIFGISFQPSEIVKFCLILYLAGWFSLKEKQELGHIGLSFVPFISLLAFILTLVVLQPDIGTAIIIVAIAMSLFFAAGGKLTHIGFICLGAALIFLLLILQAPYRLDRLTTFLNPDTDPYQTGYHINQAKIAVGSGGWLGRGLGKSIQKFSYLPEVTGDSIFAVISEETGFIFSALLILCYFLLMFKGLMLAKRTADKFGQFLVVGIISWITFQAFINIAAIIGLAPLTGVPLPFISYGGTSLMSLMAASGLLLNISKFNKQL